MLYRKYAIAIQDNSAIRRNNNIIVLFYTNEKVIGRTQMKAKGAETDFKKNVMTGYSI